MHRRFVKIGHYLQQNLFDIIGQAGYAFRLNMAMGGRSSLSALNREPQRRDTQNIFLAPSLNLSQTIRRNRKVCG